MKPFSVYFFNFFFYFTLLYSNNDASMHVASQVTAEDLLRCTDWIATVKNC